jgi:hypothetical protein
VQETDAGLRDAVKAARQYLADGYRGRDELADITEERKELKARDSELAAQEQQVLAHLKKARRASQPMAQAFEARVPELTAAQQAYDQSLQAAAAAVRTAGAAGGGALGGRGGGAGSCSSSGRARGASGGQGGSGTASVAGSSAGAASTTGDEEKLARDMCGRVILLISQAQCRGELSAKGAGELEKATGVLSKDVTIDNLVTVTQMVRQAQVGDRGGGAGASSAPGHPEPVLKAESAAAMLKCLNALFSSKGE